MEFVETKQFKKVLPWLMNYFVCEIMKSLLPGYCVGKFFSDIMRFLGEFNEPRPFSYKEVENEIYCIVLMSDIEP